MIGEIGAVALAPETGGASLAGVGWASGGTFIVPPGFNNDTFPARFQSGETVSVTPAGQSPSGNNSGIESRLDRLSTVMTRVALSSSTNKMKINLESKIDGQDIYMSNKRTSKQESRFRGAV